MISCFNQGDYTVYADCRGLVGLLDVAYRTGVTPAISPTDVWLTLVRGLGPHCRDFRARSIAKAIVRSREEMTLDLSKVEVLQNAVVTGPAQALETHLIKNLSPIGLNLNQLFSANMGANSPNEPLFADLSIYSSVGFHGSSQPSRFNRVPLRSRGKKGIEKILLRGTKSDWETIYYTFSSWEDYGIVGWMDQVLLNLEFFVDAADSGDYRFVGVEDLYKPIGIEPDEALVSGWINHFYPFVPNAPYDNNPYFASDGKRMAENRYFLGAGISRLYFPVVRENGMKEQFRVTAGSNGWFYECISDTVGLSYGWTCDGDI